MNTTLWIFLGSLLLISYSFLFIDAFRAKRSTSRKQQLPLFMMFLIGPLFYFLLSNSQRKERRQFMQSKRRFS